MIKVRLATLAYDSILTPALAVSVSAAALGQGYGSVAYDQNTSRFGISVNEETPFNGDNAAKSSCGAPTCNVIMRIAPYSCGAIAGKR
jgi:hypothetical protein